MGEMQLMYRILGLDFYPEEIPMEFRVMGPDIRNQQYNDWLSHLLYSIGVRHMLGLPSSYLKTPQSLEESSLWC